MIDNQQSHTSSLSLDSFIEDQSLLQQKKPEAAIKLQESSISKKKEEVIQKQQEEPENQCDESALLAANEEILLLIQSGGKGANGSSVIKSPFPKSLSAAQNHDDALTVEKQDEQEDSSSTPNENNEVILRKENLDNLEKITSNLQDSYQRDDRVYSRVQFARKLYCENHSNVVPLEDGALTSGTFSSVKKIPRFLMRYIIGDFGDAAKSQTDALVAWIVCHAPLEMTDKIAPFLTDAQIDLIGKWQRSPAVSLEQQIQKLSYQQEHVHKSLETIDIMLAYLISQSLDTPEESEMIDYGRDFITTALIRAEDQRDQIIKKKKYRTDRPRKQRDNDR